MSVTVGETTFERVDYDADADVLYLHVGEPERAETFEESPEGHALRFDSFGRLVGVTIVGVRALLEETAGLVITVPNRLEVPKARLRSIIHAA